MSGDGPRKTAFVALWVVLAAGLAGITLGTLIVVVTDLPEIDALERFEPRGVTVVTDIRGETVHEFFTERRIPVRLEAVPKRVRMAFLAAEDWRFYEHAGVDFKGIFRAAWKNLAERRFAEGASTITQQLSRVLFLTSEKTLARKLKEMLLALQIERRYSKNEILGMYLNQIYLGAGCYGVECAAGVYFGKKLGDVTAAETALLAGLPQAPTRFSPFVDPEAARKRRDVMLEQMYFRKLISRDEWLAAKEVPVPAESAQDTRAQSYFTAYVLGQLTGELGDEQVFRGHLTVKSTLDLKLQRAAEEAIRHGLEAYAKRHKVPADQPDRIPQAALLAVDVKTGEIRALVGGRAFSESQFNRAVQAVRQPGSAIKPVIYAAALERGYTQSSLFEDAPIRFENRKSGVWEPRNYDKKYWGPIPLRVALEHSKNMVAVRLLQAIGVPAFRQTALRLGIGSPLAADLTSALGSSSVHLTELARAYATFASGGIRPNLRTIRAVRGTGSADLWPPHLPSQPVLDRRVAFVLTDMLTGVIKYGTGAFASDLPCPVAGKTGTTDDNVDSLFVGFNSETVAVVWVGFDDRKSLGKSETGAVAAGPIWKEFMQAVCDQGGEEFAPPPGVLLVGVDHSTGKLPGRYCTDIETEAFLEGTEPKEVCREEEIPEM